MIRTDATDLASFTGDALLVLYISKREVETGDGASALERRHAIAESRETALRYRESLVALIVGYDDDPRVLAENPEVRAFFARLTREWPHWLWFPASPSGCHPVADVAVMSGDGPPQRHCGGYRVPGWERACGTSFIEGTLCSSLLASARPMHKHRPKAHVRIYYPTDSQPNTVSGARVLMERRLVD